ncbi:hypothetical protein [Streptomyces cinnamoneus]|uniref:Uncharacterized protein n=1 Tax=Streptomyces cinnamoneus TaxID=53446 RepID=A0A918TQ74_STRCJ|nr:hypothetical protein [Streptomyces cinnamoneus]GHC57310.1 hypothetical protein GCM10010507_37420 [Streptomyces cinnamoneus]
MNGSITGQRTENETGAAADGREAGNGTGPQPAAGLADVKPLPVWFFAFEGSLGAAYDLCQAWDKAWMALAALALVNIVIGFTVLRRRVKLVRAMLKNSRTRTILFALVGLRLAVHLALGAVGAATVSTAAHVAIGLAMATTTVALLWFDQRVTFRALGLLPARRAA